MNVYQLQFDGEGYIVEAETMSQAIYFWRAHVQALWGDDYEGNEEPESCNLLHDEAVITNPENTYRETLRLRRWVSDLQAGMYVNCVYCGHRYGPVSETAVSQADILKKHISVCLEHPLRFEKQNVKLMEDCLNRIIGLCKKCNTFGHIAIFANRISTEADTIVNQIIKE